MSRNAILLESTLNNRLHEIVNEKNNSVKRKLVKGLVKDIYFLSLLHPYKVPKIVKRILPKQYFPKGIYRYGFNWGFNLIKYLETLLNMKLDKTLQQIEKYVNLKKLSTTPLTQQLLQQCRKLMKNRYKTSVGQFNKNLIDNGVPLDDVCKIWNQDYLTILQQYWITQVGIYRLYKVYNTSYLRDLFGENYQHWWFCTTSGDGYCLFNSVKDFKNEPNYGNNQSGSRRLIEDVEIAKNSYDNEHPDNKFNIQDYDNQGNIRFSNLQHDLRPFVGATNYSYFRLFPYEPFNLNCILILLDDNRVEITRQLFNYTRPTVVILYYQNHFTRIECDDAQIKAYFVLESLARDIQKQRQEVNIIRNSVLRHKRQQSLDKLDVRLNRNYTNIYNAEIDRQHIFNMLRIYSILDP